MDFSGIVAIVKAAVDALAALIEAVGHDPSEVFARVMDERGLVKAADDSVQADLDKKFP